VQQCAGLPILKQDFAILPYAIPILGMSCQSIGTPGRNTDESPEWREKDFTDEPGEGFFDCDYSGCVKLRETLIRASSGGCARSPL
jgi:hypothetical protein